MTEPPRPRRHPKGRVIAILWAVLVVAAVIGVALFHDDDPTTDDGAAWGALLGLAGGILTGAYVVGSEIWNRNAARGGSRRRGLVQACAVGAVAMAAGALFVAYLAWSAPEDSPTSTTTESSATAGPANPVGAVTEAALAASDTTIVAVGCAKPVVTDETALLTCYVTFAGPSCQLWLLAGADDPDPVPFADPLDGRRGMVDEQSNRASCV